MIGILLLLFVGWYFVIQKISKDNSEKVIDNEKTSIRNSNIDEVKQKAKRKEENNGLVLINKTTKQIDTKGIKSINKTSEYKLGRYNIQVNEKQIVEVNSEMVEDNVNTQVNIFYDNFKVKNYEFKGNLISIDTQLKNKLYLQFEDVWEEGKSLYEYSFEKNSLKKIPKDYKYIECSDSFWVIHYPNYVKIISLTSTAEKKIKIVGYKFLFDNSENILLYDKNSIIAYDFRLNKKWIFNSNNQISLVKTSYLKKSSSIYIYDEISKNILNLDITNGNLKGKILIPSNFYVIDMLTIPDINGLAYIQKNDETKERYLIVTNEDKQSKVILEEILNSISLDNNIIELKNIYNDKKSFTYSLSEFN